MALHAMLVLELLGRNMTPYVILYIQHMVSYYLYVVKNCGLTCFPNIGQQLTYFPELFKARLHLYI